MTSAFGMRLHPVLKIWKLHDGTDFAAACGTAIRAVRGVVTRADFSPAYGNRLFLSHGSVDGVKRRPPSTTPHAIWFGPVSGSAVAR